MSESDEEAISVYDEIEIEDMTFDETMQIYHYPCPCGDRFEIALVDLRDAADIAVCPSCSLMIRVIFEVVSFCSCCRSLRPDHESLRLSFSVLGLMEGETGCRGLARPCSFTNVWYAGGPSQRSRARARGRSDAATGPDRGVNVLTRIQELTTSKTNINTYPRWLRQACVPPSVMGRRSSYTA